MSKITVGYVIFYPRNKQFLNFGGMGEVQYKDTPHIFKDLEIAKTCLQEYPKVERDGVINPIYMDVKAPKVKKVVTLDNGITMAIGAPRKSKGIVGASPNSPEWTHGTGQFSNFTYGTGEPKTTNVLGESLKSMDWNNKVENENL